MARKKSSRRATKKTRKPTAKRKAVARKKPAKRKSPKKNPGKGTVAKVAAKVIPVAGVYAGDSSSTYLSGGTIPPPAP